MMLEKICQKMIKGQININSINMKVNCVVITQTAFVRILNFEEIVYIVWLAF